MSVSVCVCVHEGVYWCRCLGGIQPGPASGTLDHSPSSMTDIVHRTDLHAETPTASIHREREKTLKPQICELTPLQTRHINAKIMWALVQKILEPSTFFFFFIRGKFCWSCRRWSFQSLDIWYLKNNPYDQQLLLRCGCLDKTSLIIIVNKGIVQNFKLRMQFYLLGGADRKTKLRKSLCLLWV